MATIRCDLAIATYGEKIHKSYWLATKGFRYPLSRTRSQKPPIDNQNDLLIHFLAMSYNDQVTTDGCNGQVYF